MMHAGIDLGGTKTEIVVLDDGSRLRCRRTGPPDVVRGQRVRVSSTGVATVAFPRR